MRICKACNSFFEDQGSFCANCGNRTVDYVPAPAEPAAVVDTPPAAIEPASTPVITSSPSTSAKVMSYVGMGFGIFGLALGLIFFLGSLSALADFSPVAFGLFITYSIFSMGGSIAGLCMTTKAYTYGVDSSACTVGKTLSIVGLVINILTPFISMVGAIISPF